MFWEPAPFERLIPISKGEVMNFTMSALKSATFLTATGAALWIGVAVAQPLPSPYAGNSGAVVAAVMRDHALMEETGNETKAVGRTALR